MIGGKYMMMNMPLSLVSLIECEETYFPTKEIVSPTQKKLHRLTYHELDDEQEHWRMC